jgi:hypothetical protein
MQHCHIFETVDRSFKDICNSDKPFGGLTFVFGSDFQQILPVIVKGSHAQVVGACIQKSVVWRSMTVLRLYQNMHLNTNIDVEQAFAKWRLEVGQGKHTDEGGSLPLPEHFKCQENTTDSLIDTIYPNIRTSNISQPCDYFSECTILSTTNEEVDHLNEAVLQRFPGQAQVFHSADYIPTTEQSGEDNNSMLNYPVECLNKFNCSGLPLAKLALKPGCPIMVLRNPDTAHGVCNGSRGIVTRYRNRVLEVELITGEHAGEKIFIPRIFNQPTEDQCSFKFI